MYYGKKGITIWKEMSRKQCKQENKTKTQKTTGNKLMCFSTISSSNNIDGVDLCACM